MLEPTGHVRQKNTRNLIVQSLPRCWPSKWTAEATDIAWLMASVKLPQPPHRDGIRGRCDPKTKMVDITRYIPGVRLWFSQLVSSFF